MPSVAVAQSNTEPSRGPHYYQEHPNPESIKIFAGLAYPVGSLMIVAGGKQQFFSLTRKQMLGLAAELYKGLHNMEPGK